MEFKAVSDKSGFNLLEKSPERKFIFFDIDQPPSSSGRLVAAPPLLEDVI
jgi:hypothetical protein